MRDLAQGVANKKEQRLPAPKTESPLPPREDLNVSLNLGKILTRWNHPIVRTLEPSGREVLGQALAEAINLQYPKRLPSPETEETVSKMREAGFAKLGQLLDSSHPRPLSGKLITV